MKTSIEWTQQVWNPVRGCSRVSPGCDNCYAMRMAHRSNVPGGAYEGLTTIRKGKVDWAGMARLIPEQLDKPIRRRTPTTYFVNSMSDLFHESLDNEEIASVFGVMAACPKHTFQVLTKRPKRMLEWFTWLSKMAQSIGDGEDVLCRRVAHHMVDGAHLGVRCWPLPNVWLGVSVENQEQAKRVALLLECPAAIRWVSAEPLLFPLNLKRIQYSRHYGSGLLDATTGRKSTHPVQGLDGVFRDYHLGDTNRLDWVVVGGESGNGSRLFDIQWARSLVEQCKAAGVSCFVKQLGRYPGHAEGERSYHLGLKNRKGSDMSEWPEDLRVREFPGSKP